MITLIISRTPLRASFVGGGSDLKAYYAHQPGAVVSTTINKFIYIVVDKYYDSKKYRLGYSRVEEVDNVKDVKNEILRECLRITNTPKGVVIMVHADLPSKGSGLGSSSAFTVGVLNALYAYQGKYKAPEELAKEACQIEIDILGAPIGKQDQYAAAFGGFKYIQFNTDDSVYVEPIIMSKQIKMQLERSLVMFHTGIWRKSNTILSDQKSKMESDETKNKIMSKMVAYTDDFKKALSKGDLNLIGQLLHENWMLKQKMSKKIANSQIQDWYSRALKAGALGGKLLGAGGGGHLLFLCKESEQEKLRRALKDLREVPFKFDNDGTKIIYMEDK